MKGRILLLVALTACAIVSPASAGDIARGKVLYNTRCVGCHDRSVHNREARKALTVEGIKAQVRRWDRFMEGAWGEPEVNDVTTYLNDAFYKYPCPPEVCPERKTSLEIPDSRLAL